MYCAQANKSNQNKSNLNKTNQNKKKVSVRCTAHKRWASVMQFMIGKGDIIVNWPKCEICCEDLLLLEGIAPKNKYEPVLFQWMIPYA